MENFIRIWPLKTAHMRRKPETGKRCVSAPNVSLENGTYLPPISRTITLPVKRRIKKLIAYAELFKYAYAYCGGEHRIGDASPSPISCFFCQYSDPPLEDTFCGHRSPSIRDKGCQPNPGVSSAPHTPLLVGETGLLEFFSKRSPSGVG